LIRLRRNRNTTAAPLRRQLNALKDEQFPWMREVTKNAPQQGIKNLGRAYGNFFEDLAKHRRAAPLAARAVILAVSAFGSTG
jgi:transposase